MYKTCFECPHIREYHAGRPGRVSWYCYKLTKMIGSGKVWFLDKMGNRPKICPLLKRNKMCKNCWDTKYLKKKGD